MKKIEAHKHYWLGENRQHFLGYETVIKFSEPRLFIKYKVSDAMFVDFDVFMDSIAEIQWIDGAPSKAIQKEILIEAWNFLGIEERILEEDLWDFYKE